MKIHTCSLQRKDLHCFVFHILDSTDSGDNTSSLGSSLLVDCLHPDKTSGMVHSKDGNKQTEKQQESKYNHSLSIPIITND